MIRPQKPVFAAACAAALLAGCGSSSKTSTTSTGSQGSSSHPQNAAQAFETTEPPPANVPRPQVRFETPSANSTVASTFTVKVALKNFVIDPKAVGQAPRPGRGHLHFKLDGGKFDYPHYAGPNGIVGKGLGVSGDYSPALAPMITYSHIPAGKHTLQVFLANNNHTNVGVSATETITVR